MKICTPLNNKSKLKSCFIKFSIEMFFNRSRIIVLKKFSKRCFFPYRCCGWKRRLWWLRWGWKRRIGWLGWGWERRIWWLLSKSYWCTEASSCWVEESVTLEGFLLMNRCTNFFYNFESVPFFRNSETWVASFCELSICVSQCHSCFLKIVLVIVM